MTKRYLLKLAAAIACGALFTTAFAQDKAPANYRAQLDKEVQSAIDRARKADPSIEKFFKDSVGYVVFGRVGKVGFIVAGGHGDGEVFEKGSVVGTASITIATVGLQAGGEEFSEIIFFQNQGALDRFKQNRFEFSAGMSAVILKSGAAKNNNYRDGVAVFAQAHGGVMAELSLGTQKFSFKPDSAPAPAKK